MPNNIFQRDTSFDSDVNVDHNAGYLYKKFMEVEVLKVRQIRLACQKKIVCHYFVEIWNMKLVAKKVTKLNSDRESKEEQNEKKRRQLNNVLRTFWSFDKTRCVSSIFFLIGDDHAFFNGWW